MHYHVHWLLWCFEACYLHIFILTRWRKLIFTWYGGWRGGSISLPSHGNWSLCWNGMGISLTIGFCQLKKGISEFAILWSIPIADMIWRWGPLPWVSSSSEHGSPLTGHRDGSFPSMSCLYSMLLHFTPQVANWYVLFSDQERPFLREKLHGA